MSRSGRERFRPFLVRSTRILLASLVLLAAACVAEITVTAMGW
jgi:hypothetical protein